MTLMALPRDFVCVLLLVSAVLLLQLSSAAVAFKGTYVAGTSTGGAHRENTPAEGTKPAQAALNPRPLIGILSQPGDPAPEGHSYIAASYVKFAEAGGARVVPLLVDDAEDVLRTKFEAINGVIIPGGGADLSPGHPYREQTAKLLAWAIESNKRGDPFFMHGTCLGFQLLCVLQSKADMDILSYFDSENLPSKLRFTDTAVTPSSGFLQSFSLELLNVLQNSTVSFENHQNGVGVSDFFADEDLWKFFKVLATSKDREGRDYVAMIEAFEYPVYATQFHPEKNAFEWVTTEDINHSAYGVMLMQSITNFLVSEARKSSHRPASFEQEQEMLIYNFKPEFTGKSIDKNSTHVESNFDQAYFFPMKSL